MNELIIFLVFSACGFVGAFCHYYKKRYGDKTTRLSLRKYVLSDFSSTLIATGAMLFSELVLASTAQGITLAAIAGALTAGYTSDSVLNKTADKV
jgi:hypothetical protein